MDSWPITWSDVEQARAVVRAHLAPTPSRHYAELDAVVGHGIEVWVKHENHQPTQAFKVRNGLAALARLEAEARARGIVGATRGNHGQGLAYAGQRFGAKVTVCVPCGNNPEKNAAMRALGAEVIEEGDDYEAAVAVAQRLVTEEGRTLVHSTNDRGVLAGATTLTLELLEQAPPLDAMVVAVGGGSQAVGAITATRKLAPGVAIYGVQAAGASAVHDGWHAGEPVIHPRAETFADGLATRACYPATFSALRDGLTDFVTVSDAAIVEAVLHLLRTTHNLAEGAGAAGLAGLLALAPRLANQRVGIILSGGNLDVAVLRGLLDGSLP
ncbi:MAG: pyridoxal-phosphate dependent enzyme [Polyangiaceae bacterium]